MQGGLFGVTGADDAVRSARTPAGGAWLPWPRPAAAQGFAAGHEAGVVTLFERDDREREGYRRARALSVRDHPLRVRCARGCAAGLGEG